MKGIVTKSTGSWYTVYYENGERVDCRLKGKFRMKGIKSTNPVSVGDHVIFEFEAGKETGVINTILDRKNYIIRKSVNLSKQTHIIASNIDIAFLIVTIDNPPTFTGFIDRFLASAEAYAIKTILLFNKLDIYNDDELEKLAILEDTYTNIGYQCIAISAIKNNEVVIVKTFQELLVGGASSSPSSLSGIKSHKPRAIKPPPKIHFMTSGLIHVEMALPKKAAKA